MADPLLFNIEPFFLPFGDDRLFCNFTIPTFIKPEASILYLHPFAEEMHKSRRMAALQVREFASKGYAVLQIDLLGCGDSTGDFEDASWDNWRRCVEIAIDWLTNRMNVPIILWGLRTGGMLAVDISQKFVNIAGIILWQPIINGANFINQFLRIRVATEMLASKQERTGIKQLRDKIVSGESVEIGGYTLSSSLALSIDKMDLLNTAIPCPIYWFEISMFSSNQFSPSSSKVIECWKNRGISIIAESVQGEQFWNSQEIIESHKLIVQTTKAICN